MTLTTSLLSRYEAVRLATMKLAEPLSDEDCCVQSMPEASPVKWHLAHTTWFFETFVLERFEPDFRPFDPAFRFLFNSYYNGIGEQYPRDRRGMITRPGLAQIEDYRQDVDARIAALLVVAGAPALNPDPEIERLVNLGLQHEQQHQELILTDVLHLLWQNPLLPGYRGQAAILEPAGRQALDWLDIDGGIVQIGHHGSGFCFDNELPRHRQFLEPFQIASRLVSNGEYLEFVRNGGYEDPALWLSEGWAWLHSGSTLIKAPLYWVKHDDGWSEFSLDGVNALNESAAVQHLSYFEADAYARWVGARLPTEAEWEFAASTQIEHQPVQASSAKPRLVQLFDTAWQWTASSYTPYPGFTPAQGSIGEYNGKFMVNQYVLRGGSCATPSDHTRTSYRNFFPSNARWQYTGVRLARSR